MRVRILEINIPPFPYVYILLNIQEAPRENMTNP